MIKCVDLFSGCGGLSLGFQNAGINILSSFDNWEKSVNIYNLNFNHKCYLQDIKDEKNTLSLIEQYKPNMIIGGPPCQDFSSAGKRDETKGRADLTYNFTNIICQYKPKWFVMENVDRIKKSAILDDVIQQYIENGYGLTAVVIDASYCNTPQARKRFFLIGELNGSHNALNKILFDNLNKKQMTIRDYLNDELGVDYYYRHPRNYSRRGIFSIDEPSPTVRGVNRPVPPTYKKHQGDPSDIDLSEVRALTTKERSYLQTFPKNFILEGTKTDLEQMVGNAVPVNLAKYLAECILKYINNNPVSTKNNEVFKIPEKTLHLFKEKDF